MIPPRAYTFIGLNVVRILSIIALLLVFASSLLVMVRDIRAVNALAVNRSLQDQYIADSTVPNQPAGAFWAVLNRLLIIAQTIVLLLSELGWPSKFFNKALPVLGKDFGLGALGLIECLIGAAILSHHVDSFALVSAFFLFSVGCLNILIGLIWGASARDKRSLTSWRDSTKDVFPKSVRDFSPASGLPRGVSPALPSYHSPSPSRSLDEKGGYYDSEAAPPASRIGYGFGRQGEKAAANKGYLITKPVETLPRYLPKHTNGGTGGSNPFSPV